MDNAAWCVKYDVFFENQAFSSKTCEEIRFFVFFWRRYAVFFGFREKVVEYAEILHDLGFHIFGNIRDIFG